MAKLNYFATAIDNQLSENTAGYFDLKNKEIVTVDLNQIDNVEGLDLEQLPDFVKETAEIHMLVKQDEEKYWADNSYQRRFIPLPDKFTVNEYKIMKQFISNQPETVKQKLNHFITSSNYSFFMRDVLRQMKIYEKWKTFRYEFLLKIAKDFCIANNIEI